MRYKALVYMLSSVGVALSATVAGAAESGASQPSTAAKATVAATPQSPAVAKVTLYDDFTASTLNHAIWDKNFNATQTFGSAYWSPTQVATGASHLRLIVKKQAGYGKAYVSGAVTSFGGFSQTYGRYEIRARLPPGKGMWPAFWLMPIDQSWPPEIDVFEWVASDPTAVYNTLHWQSNNSHYQKSGICHSSTLTTADHTYGVDWTPGRLDFTLDGKICSSLTGSNVPSKPVYVLMNLAIGGSWPGEPDATTPLPGTFAIRWVKVSQFVGMPAEVPLPLMFGKTYLSAYQVKAGTTIQINTSAVVGNKALGKVSARAEVYGINNSVNHGRTAYIQKANTKAGERIPFTFSYTVPTGMAPGLYSVAINLVGGSYNKSQWIANQFFVVK